MTIMAGASGLRPIPLRLLSWLPGGRGRSLQVYVIPCIAVAPCHGMTVHLLSI